MRKKNNILLLLSSFLVFSYCLIVYFGYIYQEPHEQAIAAWIISAAYAIGAGIISTYGVAFSKKNHAGIFFISSGLMNFIVSVCALLWAEDIDRNLPLSFVLLLTIPPVLCITQIFVFAKFSRLELINELNNSVNNKAA